MPTAWELLTTALILGVIDGVVPGPILTMLIGNLLKGGFRIGLVSYFWASFIDVAKAAVVVLAILSLQIPKEIFYWWSIGGGFLLFYFAYGTWKISKVLDRGMAFSVKKILVAYLTSPIGYLTWPLIYIPLMLQSGAQVRFGEFYFFGLIEFGWMIGTAAILLMMLFFRRFIKNEKIMHHVFQGLAVLLFIFGIKLIWNALVILGFLSV